MPSVLITGAARGIGRAVARAFAAQGAALWLADCDETPLEETAAELRAGGAVVEPIRMDISDEESVKAGLTRLGLADAPAEAEIRLSVLVNNAGLCAAEPVAGSDPALWRRIIDTNVVGTYLVTRRALPLMANGGRIVNMASVLGRMGVAGYSAYCASKHAIIGFTRALALELVPRRIRVNAVCPGWVETRMAAYGIAVGASVAGITKEEFERQAMAAVPIGRMLQPEEVAALVCFLASDAAEGITGQAYNICGGQAMS